MEGTKIRGITIELGGDASGLDKALGDVNKNLNNTQKQLKDVDRLLKLDPKNTELLRQKQQLLGTQIADTKSKLETLKKAQDTMDQNGVDKNSEQYMALQREIEYTEKALNKLNSEQDKLVDKSQQIAEIGKSIEKIGDSAVKAGKKISKNITAPIVAAATVSVKKYADVDKIMQLTNSTMGNTEEEAKLLNKAMSEAASQSTFGMSDAANAMLNFARAGLSAQEAAAALAPAMNLAAGEGGDLDVVSAGLVATMNAFKSSFDETAHYADVFAAACNNSALDVNGLSEAMSVAAPVFSAAGYTVEDAALYLGIMANNGIEASVAANSLKTGLARLIKPAKSGYEALENLGIITTSGVIDADALLKSADGIAMLEDAFALLSDSEKEAAVNTGIFDSSGKVSIDEYNAGLIRSADSVDIVTKAVEKLTKKQQKAMGSLGILTDESNSAFIDSEGSLMTATSLLEMLQESFRGLSESERIAMASDIFGKNQMASWLALLTTANSDVDDLNKSIETASGTTDMMSKAMMGGFGGSIEQLNSSIDVLSTQFGQFLSVYLMPIISYVQQFIAYLLQLDEPTKDIITKCILIAAAIGPILIIIGKLISGIGAIAGALSFLMANPIVGFLAALIALIAIIAIKGDEMQASLQRFDDWLQGVFAKDWTETFGPVLGGALNGFFNTVKGIWDGIKSFLDGIIDFIRGIFTGDFKRAGQGLLKMLEGIGKTALAIFKVPINGIIQLINWAIDGINGLIRGVNAVGSMLGFTIGEIGHIPMLASGGVLSSGSAIVGEAGPELLTMNQGRAVVQPLTSGRGAGGAQAAAAAPAPVFITVQSVLDGRVIAQSTTEYQERAALVHG